MLKRLRQLLRTATNSVIVGFTGTPLCDTPEDAANLLDLVKGRAQQDLSDEGFISFYFDTPSAVFPTVLPAGIPRQLPEMALRYVTLRNFGREPATPWFSSRSRNGPQGNRAEYELYRGRIEARLQRKLGVAWDAQDLHSLSRYCCIPQYFSYCGRDLVAATVHGAEGRLLKRTFASAPFGSGVQVLS